MLQYFIRSVHDRFGLGVPKPRVVIGIPSGATEVEKRAVHDAAVAAGARSSYLIEEPMAGAIGAGLPVMDATGTMIVDIGGGTTEIAVIALGGIVVSSSSRAAGDAMDQALMVYARQVHNMLIGERSAERIKMEAGSAYPLDEEETVEMRGRDLATGLPKVVELSTVEVRDSLLPVTNEIVQAVRSAIERTPPELVADLDDARHRDGGWRRAAARPRPTHRRRDALPDVRRRGSAARRRARAAPRPSRKPPRCRRCRRPSPCDARPR